jgi:hypothetical protein
MRRTIERLAILVLLAVTAAWPLLLGNAIAGRQGLYVGLLAYGAMVGLLLFVLLLGGIRGILDR